MDKTQYRFFLRGPVELVDSRNEAGRAVQLLKEEATKAGIDWTPGCVLDVPGSVPELEHILTLVELNCSMDDGKKLSDTLAPYFVPRTLDLQLRVRAFDPRTGQWQVRDDPI